MDELTRDRRALQALGELYQRQRDTALLLGMYALARHILRQLADQHTRQAA